MVKVTIELCNETESRLLGIIAIRNDGTGTPDIGNYEVALSHAGKYIGRPGAWKQGHVKGYRRSLSPYHLVKMALEATLGR